MSGKRDLALIVAMAGGKTAAEAAALCQLSERTVYRRMKLPEFRKALDAARGEALARAVAALTTASTDAVDRLKTLLTAGSEAVQLHAARAILELGTRLRQAQELEHRLRALEEKLAHVPE